MTEKFYEELKDLGAVIENYRRGYPNGEVLLRNDIYERLAELMDMDRTDLD